MIEKKMEKRMEKQIKKTIETGTGEGAETGAAGAEITIAAAAFPHRTGDADLDVFSRIPGVRVHYASDAEALGKPDMVVLPGTEDVIGDLDWMRQTGLAEAVRKLWENQIPVWGICGGYQMMGERLELQNRAEEEDARTPEAAGTPEGSGTPKAAGTPEESGLPTIMDGLGLLPTRTVLDCGNPESAASEIPVEGAFSEVEGIFEPLSGKPFSGRAVRAGQTFIDRENGPADTARLVLGRLEICRPLSYLLETGSGSKRMYENGWSRGNVYGTEVHGLFDREGIAGILVEALKSGRHPAADFKENKVKDSSQNA
ncbi:MAG: hypothetical protein Q4F29_03020 [Lachnospiraceae bacterium]|nr:hypothetical protein [Lachnospiraceae bacterium]